LPGGDFPYDGLDALIEQSQTRWPFLSANFARRLVRAYGARVDRVLGNATARADLGIDFGADLTAAEVRYLMTEEWAQTTDDVLWRRSKLGLRLSADETAALDRFMTQANGATA
jgi:glycerol-3-phosphate dehydrogenase